MFTLYAALVLFTTTKVSSLLDDEEWKEVKDPRIITFAISKNSAEPTRILYWKENCLIAEGWFDAKFDLAAATIISLFSKLVMR